MSINTKTYITHISYKWSNCDKFDKPLGILPVNLLSRKSLGE